MKLSAPLLLLSTALTASANKASLLAKSRRLEDNNNANGDDAAQEAEEYAYLMNYKIKMISCIPGQSFKNPEDGEMEYASVVYRLCPADSCDDDNAKGCKEGYGDYVVGLNSYVENWLEDKREDMQGDDDFKIEEYGECREYQVDNDDDAQNEVVYYVGPKCGYDGNSIQLGFFSDYTCTTEPDGVTFEDISNGWPLPYSSSDLVTSACEACAGYNDNGEYELSEMCMRLYEFSGKCETGMEYFGQYGPDESGCEYIQEIAPITSAKGSSVGAAIGWTILALVIVGALVYAYVTWWMKKKNSSPSGMAQSDGVMN